MFRYQPEIAYQQTDKAGGAGQASAAANDIAAKMEKLFDKAAFDNYLITEKATNGNTAIRGASTKPSN